MSRLCLVNKSVQDLNHKLSIMFYMAQQLAEGSQGFLGSCFGFLENLSYLGFRSKFRPAPFEITVSGQASRRRDHD